MKQARRVYGELARAFTLVELLVSIGVIGLLLGIILPALSQARAAAGAAKSLANLHNLGVTLHNYAEMHDGKMPFYKPGDCMYTTPPNGPRESIECISTNLPWFVSRLWPVLMHDVAPWPEHFESWLSPGHRRRPPYWPVPIVYRARFVSYDYSHSFVASPRVWSPSGSGNVSEKDIRPIRLSEVRQPSLKVVMYDAERNYLRGRGATDVRPVLMMDFSASKRKDSEATPPVQNPLFSGNAPDIYHDTPDGVHGRDH